MIHSVTEMSRAVRRRLEGVVKKSGEKDYVRRALALVHLWETGGNVAESAHRVRAARSSVYRWESSYETYVEEGIEPQSRGCEVPPLVPTGLPRRGVATFGTYSLRVRL